jgi:hypothetical protein
MSALGCQMWTRERPFHDLNEFMLVVQVLEGRRPPRPTLLECQGEPLPDHLWMLMERCWSRDPHIRPGIGQILMYFAPRWFER